MNEEMIRRIVREEIESHFCRKVVSVDEGIPYDLRDNDFSGKIKIDILERFSSTLNQNG